MTAPKEAAVVTSRRFPILQPGKGHLRSLPWEMIAPHEAQAKANHDQTLRRLAERGGLGSIEAVAVMRGVSYRVVTGMTEDAADAELRALVEKFEAPSPAVVTMAQASLAQLEAAVESRGAPTLHMNRQMLRQLLEPIRAFVEAQASGFDEQVAADLTGLRDGLREIRDALLNATGWHAARVTVDTLGPKLDRLEKRLRGER